MERAPASGSPSATASIITILRPRSWAGSHSMSGTWKIRATLVTDSGASAVHSPHAVRTRWACRQSHASMPAYAVRTGSRSNSSAVTTPKPPLPPRAAHSRSASWSSVARTNVPSASTSSTAVIALHCRPCWREYQLTPPPSDEPTTPTPGLDMCMPGQPDAAGPGDDVAPQHAGLGARRTAGGVDAQPGHRRGAQQHGVAEPARERRCAVAGALGRDPEAGRRGGPDDPGDLVGVGRVGDRGRVLVDLEVPRHPRLVVEGVAGQVDGTTGQPAQRLGVGGGEGRGTRARHHLTGSGHPSMAGVT